MKHLHHQIFHPVPLIFEIPLLVTEGMAIIGFPPGESEAQRMKSIWPPTPEY